MMISIPFKALAQLALVCIFTIPYASLALPETLHSKRAAVRSVACELFLSLDRKATLADILGRPVALSLEAEAYYDVFGILHDLVGEKLSEMSTEILSSPRHRQALEAQGGASVGTLLNTPVSDLRRLEDIILFRPDERIVDLGSGHGAPAFYFATRYPETEWLGLELVDAKVRGANRVAEFLDLRNVRFEQADLGSPQFHLPSADTYYLLNSVPPEILHRLLLQMHEVAKTRRIRIVALGMNHSLLGADTNWLHGQFLVPRNVLEMGILILESK
ncbi:MAG: class I SAM-dependent methyltransferase [Bdellovibrionales bacterium]|nr:class I SAM-dependent methyltransferase [Bdellovibrionales bacterium]